MRRARCYFEGLGRLETVIRMPSGPAGMWCFDLYATPTAQGYLVADG